MATRLNLSVTEVANSISVENNTSDVLVELYIITDGGTYNQSGDTSGYISLDGVQIKNLNGAPVYKDTKTELYRVKHTVKHNADGSKSITVKASFDVNTSVRWIYAEQALTLSAVPRASVLTVPDFMRLGTQGVMTVSKYVEGYTHTLEYTFGELSGTIVEQVEDTEIRWTPPLEEFAWQMPDAMEKYGTLTLTTYNGRGGEVGQNAYAFKAVLPANVGPSIDLVVEPVSDKAAVNEWGVAVQGKSRLRYRIEAQSMYGATIDEYTFSFAGTNLTGAAGETALLMKSGSFEPSATVKDSRGSIAAIWLRALQVYEYSPPTVSESYAYRSDAEGNKKDGEYITAYCLADCESVGGRNSVTIKLRSKTGGGEWKDDYPELPNGVETTFGGFNKDKTYEVEVYAVDTVGEERPVPYLIETERVSFHLKRDENGGAAFGKYAEKSGVLECAWDAEFGGNVKAEGAVTAADIVIGGRSLLDLLHPVGSYYISDDTTEPSVLFGGTWVKVEGRFLLGGGEEYDIGEIGGEVETILTVETMPKHGNHLFRSSLIGRGGAAGKYLSNMSTYGSDGRGWDSPSNGEYYPAGEVIGGGQPHNNMPPYYTTNIWRRTA